MSFYRRTPVGCERSLRQAQDKLRETLRDAQGDKLHLRQVATDVNYCTKPSVRPDQDPDGPACGSLVFRTNLMSAVAAVLASVLIYQILTRPALCLHTRGRTGWRPLLRLVWHRWSGLLRQTLAAVHPDRLDGSGLACIRSPVW